VIVTSYLLLEITNLEFEKRR